MCRYLLVSCSALCLLLILGCRPPAPPGRPLTRPTSSIKKKVLFVPLDRVDPKYLNTFADYYRQKLGIDITLVKTPYEYPSTLFDQERKQVKANALLLDFVHLMDPDLYRSGLPDGNYSKYKVIVMVTDKDIYSDVDPGGRFAFSVWSGPLKGEKYEKAGFDGVGLAVISMARLNPAFYKERPSSKKVRERLRKQITQKLGSLYYELPRNDDPSSVLYHSLSIEDIDRMGEGF